MNKKSDIIFLGDIAFFPSSNLYDVNPDEIVIEYGSMLNCDLKMANFEFPLTVKKIAHFKNSHTGYIAPRISLEFMRHFNFDLLSLANNHILDWGMEGIQETINSLNKLGIATLGAGENEQAARKSLIFERNGIKFGFLAYCKNGQNCATPNTPGAAALLVDNVRADIEALLKYVDHVIVNLHWGVEFSDYPYPNDVKIAHSIIDYGASCIIGHHPHVVQGMEIYKGRPIFYSLGSFIYNPYHEKVHSNIKMEERLTSIGVKIYFGKEDIKRWEIFPFRNARHSLFPRALMSDSAESKEFFRRFQTISDRISECEKWFYRFAIGNLAIRQVKTIFMLLVKTRGMFIFQLISSLKIRHLKIVLGPFYSILKK